MQLLPQALREEVLPVALDLSRDSTAAVRMAVAAQMGTLVQSLWYSCCSTQQDAVCNAPSTTSGLPETLIPSEQTQQPSSEQSNQMTSAQSQVVHELQSLAQDTSFQIRQQFVEICYYLAIVSDHFAVSVFRTHFLPSMVRLACDSVSNVRLTLARVLSRLRSQHCSEQLSSTLETLSHDANMDVSNCCNHHSD